jgi:hypothetical protein
MHHMKRLFTTVAVLISALHFVGAPENFAQNSLTPPGAPTPTMKTLDQVKPGIPIDPSKAGFTTPYNITTPGNYYLAGNISVTSGDAIGINAVGVTVDLNGFTISSSNSAKTGTAILISGGSDISIKNGHITGTVTNPVQFTGSGFANGIFNPGGAVDVRVSGMSIFGCFSSGINVGNAGTVESSKVSTINGGGISAGVISRCTATTCSQTALSGTTVSDSSGDTIAGLTVHNCAGGTISGNAVENCSASGAINTQLATNCQVSTNSSSTALTAQVAINCIASNSGGGPAFTISGSAANCFASTPSGTAFSLSNYGSLTGCQGDGAIVAGTGCTISSCQVFSGPGITGGTGSNVTGCAVYSAAGNGITVGGGSSVTNCAVTSSNGNGIVLGDHSTAQNCVASGNSGDGITVTVECSVLNCNASTNTGNGIHLLGNANSNNRIDGNNASNNTAIGILQHGGPDLIVRNLARSNGSGTNYSPSSGTSVGPIGTPNTATSPWANFQ